MLDSRDNHYTTETDVTFWMLRILMYVYTYVNIQYIRKYVEDKQICTFPVHVFQNSTVMTVAETPIDQIL